MTAVAEKIMTVEEYIQFELKSERRHEYINGQLFEMPGEKDTNNEIAGFLYAFFRLFFKKKSFYVYSHDIKVAIPKEEKFYYPDVFITKERKTEDNRYIKQQPELIVEVISKTSYINDTVNKFIDYTKILSLKYYITVNSKIPSITLYSRDTEGQWQAEEYGSTEQTVTLPLLGLELPLEEIFEIIMEG